MVAADIVIIGAGPSGLAVGACLARRGLRARILERGETLGWSWAGFYESMRLHTPRSISALPGLPLATGHYPERAELFAYLEAYAQRANLQIECGCEATSLLRENGGWRVDTSRGALRARHVVIASGWLSELREPELNGREKFGGRWLRPVDVRSRDDWKDRRVLVVGLGNTARDILAQLHRSGAQIAVSVRSSIWIAPREILGANSFRWKRWIPERMLPVRRLGKTALRVAEWIGGHFWWSIQECYFRDLRDHGLSFKSPDEIMKDQWSFRVPVIAGLWVDLLRRGQIAVFPGIAEFTSEGAIFVNGLRESFTDIVLATGFSDRHFPLAGDLKWPPRDGAVPGKPGLWLCGARPALQRIGPAARRIARRIARDMRRLKSA